MSGVVKEGVCFLRNLVVLGYSCEAQGYRKTVEERRNPLEPPNWLMTPINAEKFLVGALAWERLLPGRKRQELFVGCRVSAWGSNSQAGGHSNGGDNRIGRAGYFGGLMLFVSRGV